jgi:decaprenylphospho-beta-D-ribofuranose 2-oxidase
MQANLVSFDGTETHSGEFARPDRFRHLFDELDQATPAIARGAGLSYCAASSGPDVRTVSALRFNRILEFDAAAGTIVVEPGLRLGELYRFITPRGWSMPILPGHPSITVGGCIGCNVHGKNHVRDGSFVNVVESLSLFHPDHGEIDCSRTERPEVFELTVGGFGLTGFVTAAKLRLKPLHATSIRVRRQPVANLRDAVMLLRENRGFDLLYSWHDFNARGDSFGRGFVYTGESVASADAPTGDIRYRVLTAENRRGLPTGPFAAWFTRTAARVYGLTQYFSPAERTLDLASASFPINGKEIYFRLFGRAGFREYQALFPFDRWDEASREVGRLIGKHRVSIGLASLKLFGGGGSLLRFDGEGVCLALDAPAGPRATALFADLDRLAETSGALVNLSKDSRLDAGTVARLYTGYDAFREGLARFDPRRRFSSALRNRLDV